MGVQKNNLPINFAQGLDLKSDPFQVQAGKMLGLVNSVFTKMGLLAKRNGYGDLTSLPSADFKHLTTYSGGLTAIGTRLDSYSSGTNAWVDKGAFQPASVNTQAVVRSATNQTHADSALAPNGLLLTAYTDVNAGTTTYKYTITDSATGEAIVNPIAINPVAGVITGSPRTFMLGGKFILVISTLDAGVNRLKYIAINSNAPTIAATAATISSQYTPSASVAFDGYVVNNSLYLAWNSNSASIHMTRLDSNLAQSNTITFTGRVATIMSVTADSTGNAPIVWATFYDSGTSTGYTLAVDQSLNTVLAPTLTIASGNVTNIATTAANSSLTELYEVPGSYSYDSGIPTNHINKVTVSQTGTVSSTTTIARGTGLASKAFIYNGATYALAAYDSVNQPSYFLIDEMGRVIAKLAYSNGGGYVTTGLPEVTLVGSQASLAYLYRAIITPVNKTQGLANSAGIYTQTGVNSATFELNPAHITSSEIGGDLNLSGGFLWMYDGAAPVEQGFHLWPDDVEVTTAGTGGFLAAQEYFYQALYEWTDAVGNIFRSAPSIPVSVTTTGTTSANTVNVPTLRLTYKTATPIKIQIYRWSTAQQSYYQVTTVNAPLLNDTTTNSVAFVDTMSDADILGNALIYTTGGVVENIPPNGTDIMALYKSRLITLDSENRNVLWYSKQVIQNVPVEMSDLFTIYVAPTTAAQGNTGFVTALSALDDKLIIFKKDAIYYITGTGPDNTGAQNDFSEPTFVTSTVGCVNQQSIVMMPQGLMFQSDKGIWLLDRSLNTTYIGAAVENYNTDTVVSSVNVPGTNQVRFHLASGITLMYDYYFGQWGTFVNVPAISSTLYQALHTYIDKYGRALQESPGKYLDGSKPVLMSFTTAWLNLAGLQGYERAYFFYILGVYITPHKLNVQIAYDYNSSPTQATVIIPDNFTPNWGGEQLWGSGGGWGGNGNIEQHRVFLQQQKCQAFQITIEEIYDSTMGGAPGAGLTLSGIDLIVGVKDNKPKLRASRSVG